VELGRAGASLRLVVTGATTAGKRLFFSRDLRLQEILISNVHLCYNTCSYIRFFDTRVPIHRSNIAQHYVGTLSATKHGAQAAGQ
jgi:predicted membrane-bound mannosyltransferase